MLSPVAFLKTGMFTVTTSPRNLIVYSFNSTSFQLCARQSIAILLSIVILKFSLFPSYSITKPCLLSLVICAHMNSCSNSSLSIIAHLIIKREGRSYTGHAFSPYNSYFFYSWIRGYISQPYRFSSTAP